MTTLMRAVGIGAAAVLLGGSVFVRAQSQPAGARQESVDYAKDIEPIFKTYCYECHGPKARGRLRLTTPESIRRGGTSGAVITPGKSADSLMIHRVLGLDGDDRMPLDGDPLPADAIARLRAWIDQGARVSSPDRSRRCDPNRAGAGKGGGALGLRKAVRPPLPAVKSAAWVRNPIDQFVLARLEREELAPAHEASEGDTASASDAGSDRVAADACTNSTRSSPTPARRHTSASSTGCSRRRTTASDGPAPGSTWPATPTQRLRERQPARDLEVPRLGDRRAQSRHAVRSVHDRADRRRHAAGRDARAEDCERFPPQRDDQRGGGRRSRGVDVRGAGGSRQHDGDGVAGHDARLRAVPQPQVRSVQPEGLLPAARVLRRTDYESRTFGDGTRYSEPTLDLATPEQESARKTQQAEIDRLEQELKTVTPARPRGAEHVGGVAAAAEAGWTPLAPKAASATNGVDAVGACLTARCSRPGRIPS